MEFHLIFRQNGLLWIQFTYYNLSQSKCSIEKSQRHANVGLLSTAFKESQPPPNRIEIINSIFWMYIYVHISNLGVFIQINGEFQKAFYILQIFRRKTKNDSCYRTQTFNDGIAAVSCKNPWKCIYVCSKTITIWKSKPSIFQRVKLYVW